MIKPTDLNTYSIVASNILNMRVINHKIPLLIMAIQHQEPFGLKLNSSEPLCSPYSKILPDKTADIRRLILKSPCTIQIDRMIPESICNLQKLKQTNDFQYEIQHNTGSISKKSRNYKTKRICPNIQSNMQNETNKALKVVTQATQIDKDMDFILEDLVVGCLYKNNCRPIRLQTRKSMTDVPVKLPPISSKSENMKNTRLRQTQSAKLH